MPDRVGPDTDWGALPALALSFVCCFAALIAWPRTRTVIPEGDGVIVQSWRMAAVPIRHRTVGRAEHPELVLIERRPSSASPGHLTDLLGSQLLLKDGDRSLLAWPGARPELLNLAERLSAALGAAFSDATQVARNAPEAGEALSTLGLNPPPADGLYTRIRRAGDAVEVAVSSQPGWPKRLGPAALMALAIALSAMALEQLFPRLDDFMVMLFAAATVGFWPTRRHVTRELRVAAGQVVLGERRWEGELRAWCRTSETSWGTLHVGDGSGAELSLPVRLSQGEAEWLGKALDRIVTGEAQAPAGDA